MILPRDLKAFLRQLDVHTFDQFTKELEDLWGHDSTQTIRTHYTRPGDVRFHCVMPDCPVTKREARVMWMHCQIEHMKSVEDNPQLEMHDRELVEFVADFKKKVEAS